MGMQIKPQWDITLYLLECFYQKRQSTSVSKDVEKREPLCTVDGKVNQQTHRKQHEVPSKIKNRTNIWCSNSISEFYLGEKKMPILKYICTPKFTTALFYNNQDMESKWVHWEMNG